MTCCDGARLSALRFSECVFVTSRHVWSRSEAYALTRLFHIAVALPIELLGRAKCINDTTNNRPPTKARTHDQSTPNPMINNMLV